jgi:hypothetical protein
VRLGGGNLKSVVVFLFLGYTALVTMNGILRHLVDGVLRAEPLTIHLDGLQTLPSLLGMADKISQLAVGVVLGLLIAGLRILQQGIPREPGQHPGRNRGGLRGGRRLVRHRSSGLRGNPETMELTYMGTDSHLAESMTFVGPLAYTMDLWAYWRDKHVTFGVASVFGVVVGSFLYSVFQPQLPLGVLQFPPGHVPASDWRRSHGLRRHHGHGMHHRTGGDRRVDFIHQFLHCFFRDRRRRGDHHENPVLFDDARSLIRMSYSRGWVRSR